ncbi:MAG TPA: TIGR00730 family Rossman fold protein [Candidatus Paceibacterota bacterium]
MEKKSTRPRPASNGMNITVFCSQYDVADKYKETAKEFAELLATGGHTLVWGCGDEGLMHIIADAAQSGGARIVGVIREEIKEKAFKTADEVIIVPNAYEMNLGLIERGDAIVSLVGGIGTLNELTEVIRMRKNGKHNKPLVIVNTDNFYGGLKGQLEKMHSEGFLTENVMDAIYFADTPTDAMSYIENHGT